MSSGLSELLDDQSDEALALLESSVLGDEGEAFVVAANHGQILDCLRDLGARQGRQHPLRKPVQDAFLSGAHRDAKDGLMACADIAGIQSAGSEEHGNLYDNVFSANLPAQAGHGQPVFRAIAPFGIGEETTNRADGLLVYGRDDAKLSASFERSVASHAAYGATAPYLSAQERYLEGRRRHASMDSGRASQRQMAVKSRKLRQ